MRVELATRLGNYRRDPLYRNSFAITLSGIIGSLFGLLFWLAAARLMSTAEVGLGTAIISVIVLITSLAMLGMDIGLTRYLPETTDKSALYSTTFVVTFCVSIVITSIFLAGLSFFSPSLLFLRQGWYSLSLFSVIGAVSVYQLAYTALIASRRGDLSLFQNLSLGLRVPLLLFIYPFGVLAIYSAYGAAYFVALVIGSLLLINQGISLKPTLDFVALRKILRFSFGNYTAMLFTWIPGGIIPLLVLDIVGASANAYYYIAYSIYSVLLMVSAAVSLSLMVEGSHNVPLRESAFKSIRLLMSVLIPSVLIVFLFGDKLLGLFGASYANNALEVLKLLAASSLFAAVTAIYISVKRVQKDTRSILHVSIASSALILALSYVSLRKYGLIGAGYASLLTNFLICVYILWLVIHKERWL
jgi:O-antigen/teichoic acid export membrane protein